MFSKVTVAGCFCLLLSAVAVMAEEQKMSMEDMITAIEGMSYKCDPMPTREMIREFLEHAEEPTPETKCFERCLMDMYDMFLPNSNTLNGELITRVSSVMYSGRDAEITEMVKVCNEKYSGIDEKCEASHQLSKCMYKIAKEKNFPMPSYT